MPSALAHTADCVLPVILGNTFAEPLSDLCPKKITAAPCSYEKLDAKISNETVSDEGLDAMSFVRRYEHERNSYAMQYARKFVSASGAYLFDDQGSKYIDCLNGFGVNAFGHNPPFLKRAMHEFLDADCLWQSNDMFTNERAEFNQKLFSVLPPELCEHRIAFTGPTGTEANEWAIKLARASTGRSGIWCFRGGFHGSAFLTHSLTSQRRGESTGIAPHTMHLPFPHELPQHCPFEVGGDDSVRLCLAFLKSQLSDSKGGPSLPAAIILEPVQSDGGIVPAPSAFIQGVYDLCKAHGILYISDEVQTGFGKCGTLFGYQRTNICPDILTCSKAWGGGLPLAFVLYASNLGGLPHSGTFRGNQMALRLGAICLDHLYSGNYLQNVKTMERFWQGAASQLQTQRGVLAVRVAGALVGIEMETAQLCETAFHHLLEHGVLCKMAGRDKKTLVFWMQLNLTEEICGTILQAVTNAIVSTCHDTK
jgi:diaminobutyrate-2-oxoglutarate transaminase